MADTQPYSSLMMMTDSTLNADGRTLLASPSPSPNTTESIDSINSYIDKISSLNDTQDKQKNYTRQNNPSAPVKSSQLKPMFKFGPYVPVVRRDDGTIVIDPKGVVESYNEIDPTATNNRINLELFPDDAIVETPSLVTPLLLKKKTIWPSKEPINVPVSTQKSQLCESNDQSQSDSSDDGVEIVKVVNCGSSNPTKIDNQGNVKSVNDYIRSATVANLVQPSTSNSILAIDDYYKSSAGEMLFSIGMSRVREYNLEVGTKKLANKIRKAGDSDTGEQINELEALRKDLTQTKLANESYQSKLTLRCPHCCFKSDSHTVIGAHLEVPHLNSRKEYLCNWCSHKTKDANEIAYHNHVEHKKRCKIDRPLALHLCSLCPYECRSKRKLTSHSLRCQQFFPHNDFLGPKDYGEGDFPAITSKMITQNDVSVYEQTLKALRMASYSPNHFKVGGYLQKGSHQSIIVVPRPIKEPSSSFTGISEKRLDSSRSLEKSPFNPLGVIRKEKSPVKPNNNCGQILQLISAKEPKRMKTTLLQYPKDQSKFVNAKSVLNSAPEVIMMSNSHSNGKDDRPLQLFPSSNMLSGKPPNPKGSTFVICEICDGFIKDLNQLKSHMQWIHKVKIHLKSLESRPPLNCQKCQWRFFTDQGLERHLLGAHGLVTSNMQEQVDKGTDSGRCTVCGRAYANKLVSHMKETHKTNLKSAHLSYKCTVCSATFNLYRLFEDHVYSVHSESVKRFTSN